MRVLVVEDVVRVAQLIVRGLQEEGFAVDVVGTGREALWMVAENGYDVIVLDLGLPDLDGREVCTELRRQRSQSPVLMLTARDAIDDRVDGLDSGADDYLTKPFAFAELTARLRALVRRGRSNRGTTLAVGDLTLNPATRAVTRGATAIALTAKEFALLEYLMRRAGEVVTRAEILANGWDFAFEGDPHIVTVYMGTLRDKIDRPFQRASLVTIRGVGYRMIDDLAAQ